MGSAAKSLVLEVKVQMHNFLSRYERMFSVVQGMSSLDAMLMFMAYSQVMSQAVVVGHTLEIGVHHGLSSIAVSALRGQTSRFVAIDLFDALQSANESHSGLGNRAIFLKNMEHAHGATDFIELIAKLSAEITATDLGNGFTFCHVDGGHSARETCSDLELCSNVLVPGGLLAMDDYFNPNFPGVCEGAVQFSQKCPGVLKPIAIGYNKVLFQKTPAPLELNAALIKAFPGLPHKSVTMWEQDVLLHSSALRSFFSLTESTPQRLVKADEVTEVILLPELSKISVQAGHTAVLPVLVRNRSTIPLRWSDSPIGLSYHLLSQDGRMLIHDNPRTYFVNTVSFGEDLVVNLVVSAPTEAGKYELEIDIVWEGLYWFKEKGNPTVTIPMSVL